MPGSTYLDQALCPQPKESWMTKLLPDPTNLPAKKSDMRVFLDTEFLEANGHFKFISVGLVTDRGHEFYAEVPVHEAANHPTRQR